MPLQLHKTQPSPELSRIEITGKLIMAKESSQVESIVANLLQSGVKKIVFDLSKVDGIDSTGVGIIVVCHAKLQKAGGTLRIAGPTGIVLETLQMTHLDRLVPIFASAHEAERASEQASEAHS
jgi:anti-anti-sigma factor